MSGPTKVFNGQESIKLRVTLTQVPAIPEYSWPASQQVKKVLVPQPNLPGPFAAGIYNITSGKASAGGGLVNNNGHTDHDWTVSASDVLSYYSSNLNMSLGVWSTWNQTNGPVQFNLRAVYQEVLGTIPNKTILVSRGLVSYPPDWETQKYQVVIQAKQNAVSSKEYMVVWEEQPLPRKAAIPPGNPPQIRALYFPYQMTVTTPGEGGAEVAAHFKVYRRVVPGALALWTSGQCPPGQTIYISEADDSTATEGEPGDGSAPPAGEAEAQNPDGTGTGTTAPTGGDGTAPGGATGGTGGGAGTGLTQAEVQQAVRDGTKQAANDSTGDGFTAPSDGEAGVITGTDNSDVKDGWVESTTELKDAATSLRNVVGGEGFGAKFQMIQVPDGGLGTVSGITFTIPKLGTQNIDFAPYSTHISLLRRVMLAILTVGLFFSTMQIYRYAIS